VIADTLVNLRWGDIAVAIETHRTHARTTAAGSAFSAAQSPNPP
jgi:hypothetical protein